MSDYSRNYTRWSKRQASKTVRKYYRMIAKGKAYRKLYESWNIFDYKHTTFEEDSKWFKIGKRK